MSGTNQTKNGLQEISPLFTKRNAAIVIGWLGIGTVLFLTSQNDYLLFHSIAELFSIAIAFTVFFLAWNTRHIVSNNLSLFLGIAFLFIGILDSFHMLSYKGMGVFGIEDANPATQFWIAARYLQAVSFLLAPVFAFRKLRIHLTGFLYMAVTGLLIASINYWHVFPDAFVTGSGLTTFKIVSEYIIAALLILSIWVLYRNRSKFSPRVVRLVFIALVISVASEMAFTLYTDVYGILNMTGHFLKILAFFLIYRAFIVTGLRNPYETMFRDLKASEENLEKINIQLQQEIEVREEIEMALLEAEKYLKRAQEVAKLGNWRFGTKENLLLWSEQAYEIFTVPEGTPVHYDYFIQLVHPEDREYVDNEWKAALQGEVYDIEHRIITKDGIKWVREIAELEFDDDGNLKERFGTVQDITDIKKVEQMKDEFIGLVSHELRTPLTIIIGSLKSSMSHGISEEDKQELIENAADGAESLSEILENMLELSRHQSGRLQLEQKPVSLQQVTEKTIERLKTQKVIRKFHNDISPDIPEIKADALRVERIVHNLLENAAKYSEESGDIIITARVKGNHVITEITDHGEGIAPEDQDKVFELFQRFSGRSGSKSGIGLGLVVCKRLVEAQKGWIDFTSTPGEGTVFRFALPVYIA